MNILQLKRILACLALSSFCANLEPSNAQETNLNPKDQASSDQTDFAGSSDHRDRGLIFNTAGMGAGAASSSPEISPPVKSKKIGNSTKSLSKNAAKMKTAKTAPVLPATSPAKSALAPSRPMSSDSNYVTVSHQVNLSSGDVMLKASLNKAGTLPKYKVGEKMVINVSASTECNLLIFDFDGKNTLRQIFPNQYQPAGLVKSGQLVTIGGEDSPFDYQVSGRGGTERLFVYAYPASESSSPLSVAMAPLPHSPFRSADMTLDQYRALVNNSKVFFSREVKVVPKSKMQSTAFFEPAKANKVELTFEVEP